jgi:pectate lyase
MKMSTRNKRVGFVLLGVTLILWILAMLFLFRVTDFFHRILLKFPGPVIIYGAMFFFPLMTMWIGVRSIRAQQDLFRARVFVGFGTLLVVAFILVMVVPMISDALAPKPDKNPSVPRAVEPPEGLPVFPGAEGFGTLTVAGRGGKVIEVTSLADDGPGTLRAAINDPEPRIIVFSVAGTIEVQSELQIGEPFVTIAGQTAPGGGICIKGAGITITTHDVLIQHLRVRPGNKGPVDADINDAVSILGRHGENEGAYNVVIDHISASWGEDETISTWYGAHDITISWSIISEALNRSRHRKETHSAGVLIGDSSYHVSIHHNLLAHNDFRNPLFIGGGTHAFVNNVIYNWGVLAGEIVDEDANTFLNFIGNTYLPGPSSNRDLYEILFEGGNPLIYVEDNFGPHRSEASMDDWALVGIGYGDVNAPQDSYRSFTRFPTYPISAEAAKLALENVLMGAGATAPLRDVVDTRIVADVRNSTGKIIDSPEDVGGYPELSPGQPPEDSDHDGIPDNWELEKGLDPLDPSDGNGDLDQDGYTNIEEYLHFLAIGE